MDAELLSSVSEDIGSSLPVTNIKDFGMAELWDDRAIQVVFNEGTTHTPYPLGCSDEFFGRAAYMKYREVSEGKNLVSGQTIPPWDELRHEIQTAWVEAANEVRRTAVIN